MHFSPVDPPAAWVRRRVIAPLWARYEGTPYLTIAAARAREDRISLEARREAQWKQLGDLVRHAARNSPFYREQFAAAGFEPGDLRSWSDLEALPVLTKDAVRAHGPELIASPFRSASLREKRTSGSTGISLTLFADEDCMQTRRGLTLYRDRWTGWDVTEPRAMVWGNPPPVRSWRQRLRRALLERDFYLDTLGLSEEMILAFSREILDRRPTLLFGHAHSLYLVARFWKDHGLPEYRFRGVISTAMVLHPFERKSIEETFGPVFDRYGCEEVSLIASECEAHDGLHVNMDGVVVEIVEDRPDAPGRILVTDLLNRGMPFIRYDVGDRGSWQPGVCTCGRSHLRLREIAGRIADYLTTPDGRQVSGISLTENFATLIPGVDQIQVIQDRRDHLRVRTVPAPDFSPASRETMARLVETVFGPGMRFTLETVPRIPPEPSGKFRFSINQVDPQGPGSTPGESDPTAAAPGARTDPDQ